MCEADDRIRMQHMLDAANAGMNFINGKTRDDLDHDLQLVFALVRAVEIIGEAAAHVAQDCRDRYPHIPWKQIKGMRNILIHHYFDVDLDQVWKTATVDLPALVADLEPILNSDESDNKTS